MSDSARTPTPKSNRRKGGPSKKASAQTDNNQPQHNRIASVGNDYVASSAPNQTDHTHTPPSKGRNRKIHGAPNHSEYASDSQAVGKHPASVKQKIPIGRAAAGNRSDSTSHNSHQPAGNPAATPAKQAYAGPTFHASPAASALPMPKFFSKSVPAEALPSKLQEQLATENEERNDAHAQKQRPGSGQNLEREESPLDFLLNAHRKEQQKMTPDSSQKSSLRPTVSASSSATSTSRSSKPNHFRHPSGPGMTNKDIFMMEMDGASDGQETDDATGTPSFQQRLQALQSKSSSNDNSSESERLAQTEALKRLLFPNGAQHEGQGTERTRDLFAPTHPPQGTFQQPYHSDSGAYRGSSHNATPPRPNFPMKTPPNHPLQSAQSSESQMSTPRPDARGSNYPYPSAPPQAGERDVKSMESDLRRMLKLDGLNKP